MKYKHIIPFIALAGLSLTSCDETKMEWYKDPSHGEVSSSELPLELAEKISRYDALKTYANFTLGIGVGLDLYLEDETYRNIVEENFDEITIGYEMKHGAMVNSNGELNFTKVDKLITRLQSVGLGLYGHTLVWHQNQNASYLNGLIAPTVIPAPAGSNLVDLSGLKDGSISNGWNPQNKGAGITIVEGKGLSSTSQAVEMISSSSSSQAYNLQLISPDITAISGHTYEISFYIRSDQPGKGRISFSGLENNYPYKDWYNTGASWTESFATTSEWKQVLFTVNDFAATTFKMQFDLGYLPDVTYYIDVDNIWVRDLTAETKSSTTKSASIIEKTDEEKAEIIEGAMSAWISQMVTHCKGIINAWDVVNEPMDDSNTSALKTGEGKELSSDEFYWQDYLGKDYAVTAFKLARQYGNANDKLFINDYNLEYNLSKCDGLIAYVQYIESKGAVVDGIGTQMHISINTNKDNIVQMFQKLAATGKLIKISELDITIGTASPTTAQLATQAEMYQYVIDAYRTYIPAAQQYTITIWGVSDNAKEHEYWLPDDAPNLWDANYKRKHAYKGVADGLAGRDVSEDFTGDLQY